MATKRSPSSPDSESLDALRAHYAAFQALDLSLDMTRGKPCPEQLDLSNPLLDCVTSTDFQAADGTDCRNYGGLDGLPEAKALFAEYLGVALDEVLIGGNSSLSLMHDAFARCLLHGTAEAADPWQAVPDVSFLCPVPGYDRHFSVCENLGVRMIPVPMTDAGPDVEVVERLAAEDVSVRGMWIVPRYSNPTGATISPENATRLARMKTAASDFRLFWDDAYAVHALTDAPATLPPILELCRDAGVPNRPFLFGSTSKISFAGAGLSVMGGSTENLAWMRAHAGMQTIGPDKLNQLRHVRFFRDLDGIRAHMQKHRAIIAPKFEAVLRILDKELGTEGDYATWNRPEGGYFISLDTEDGLAKRVVELAGEAGVKLTPAGATFPYRNDPRDRNIRLSPTFPSLDDIEQAMQVVTCCIKLATHESGTS